MNATAHTPEGKVAITGRTTSELEAAADLVGAYAYRFPVDGGRFERLVRLPGTGWTVLS